MQTSCQNFTICKICARFFPWPATQAGVCQKIFFWPKMPLGLGFLNYRLLRQIVLNYMKLELFCVARILHTVELFHGRQALARILRLNCMLIICNHI
jgi:hypothetical protein